jgi:hypothetical protein
VKGLAFRTLRRKRTAAPLDHIDDQLGVFPVFALRFTDVKRTVADLAQAFVARADGDLARQIAVGGTNDKSLRSAADARSMSTSL